MFSFKQSLARISAAFLLAVGLTLPATAGDVTIQSIQSGKYAAFTGIYLAANASQAGAFVFQEVHMGGNSYAFRDRASGRYLRAGVTSNTLMALGGTEIGTWEHFEVVTRGGVSALRSMQNGKYVRAGIGRDSLFGAVSDRRGGWQEFRITPVAALAPPPVAGWRVPFAGSWRLRDINDRTGLNIWVDHNALRAAEFTINEDGRFTFSAGCNDITGRIVQEPAISGFSFANVFSTRVNCANPAYALERSILSFLGEIHFARMGARTLDFVRNPRGPIAIELYQR